MDQFRHFYKRDSVVTSKAQIRVFVDSRTPRIRRRLRSRVHAHRYKCARRWSIRVLDTHVCFLSLFLSVCLCLSFFFSRSISFSFSSAAFKGIYVTGTCARGTGRPTLWTPLFAKGLRSTPFSCPLPLPLRHFYPPPFVPFTFLSAVLFLSNRDSLSRRACNWSKM